ncbi:SprT-like family-domain-containing protein [Phaeosphaeriaceae sp. PMI808]|nr:SprT-like family-domain-containing protein [Phaeosphaeriaceae sp. PMI808]
MPPSATRATRSSPRKTKQSPLYTGSSDEETSVLVPKISKRELRFTNSSHDVENSLRIPKTTLAYDALTPRKQRILRPVESNSRLLRKLSYESLASPEKPRERRVRSGTTDTDVGKKTSLMYSKSLVKSVIKKQLSKAKISVIEDEYLREPARSMSREESTQEKSDDETNENVETTLCCGDEEETSQDKDEVQVVETSDEDDDDPVVDIRRRRQQTQRRRLESVSDDESEQSVPEPQPRPSALGHTEPQSTPREVTIKEHEPLTSMRPPHRKNHSTISTWAQDVVDLTSSPEPPTSFIVPPLPPPTRVRTASFASSRPHSSSSNGGLAVLTYSPTPTKSRSHRKAPPITRPATPPLARPSPSKLVSPSKKKPTIPKESNPRPSLDAFWDPEVVNDYNERHSPVKVPVSPKKQKWRDDIVKMMEGIALEDEDSSNSDGELPSPTASPQKKKDNEHSSAKRSTPESSSCNIKNARAQRKAFAEQKHAIAESFLVELDTTIAQGQISSLTSQTGGIKLIWSKTLKTTAGRANWKREQIRLRTGSLPSDFRTEIRHHCSIELAEKVIDDSERLYNVLAHEFCHLTTFMISNVRNNPHGAEFKAWGRKATQAFAQRGVEVTTKHSYAIAYKYVWECVSCGYEFKRHSKSVDTARHSCGKCKGRLVQTKPTPRGVGVAGKKEKSEYQVFVKENFARVKKGMVDGGESGQMSKVMEAVAREYRESKAQSKDVGVGGLEEALEDLKI